MNKSRGLLKTVKEKILPSSNLPQLPLWSAVSILSPPLPPHRFSKVMVSPRSLEVDSKWQHSCDSKYQVIVLSILLSKLPLKKPAIVLITTWDYKGSML